MEVINHPAYPGLVEVKGRMVKSLKFGQEFNGSFVVLSKRLERRVFRLTCKGLIQLCGSTIIGELEDHRFTNTNYFNFGNPLGKPFLWQNGFSYGINSCTENDIASVEVDMDNRTIHFFVNNTLQPVSYSGVPSPIIVYASVSKVGSVMEIISFEALQHSSVLTSTPVAPIYDPDRQGLQARVVEWRSEGEPTSR